MRHAWIFDQQMARVWTRDGGGNIRPIPANDDMTEVTVLAPVSPQYTTVTYSNDAIADLLFMLEEEKLAGDIYELFHDVYGLTIFDNIAQSEDNHYDALLAQAQSLGLDVDEILLAPTGSYVNEDLQDMYDDLVETGLDSLEGALTVGVLIETKDMVDIAEAAEAVAGTPLEDVYMSLLAGSENHLQAFETLL